MTKPDITLRREWRAEEREDGCYVIETGFGLEGCLEYGPMPESVVLRLISECHACFKASVESHMLRMMEPIC